MNKSRKIVMLLTNMTRKMKYSEFMVNYTIDDKKSGIYIIYNGKSAIYVGKSIDLRERLLAHLSDNEPNYNLKKCVKKYDVEFQVIYENSEKECSRLENILYDYHYHPLCNQQRPDKFK